MSEWSEPWRPPAPPLTPDEVNEILESGTPKEPDIVEKMAKSQMEAWANYMDEMILAKYLTPEEMEQLRRERGAKNGPSDTGDSS